MIELFQEQLTEIVRTPGWHWYKIRSVGSFTIFNGAVCTILYKSGPKKGRLNWTTRDKSTEREIILTNGDIDRWRKAWSERTGKCLRCTGDGRMVIRVSASEGTSYRECRLCLGTGERLKEWGP